MAAVVITSEIPSMRYVLCLDTFQSRDISECGSLEPSLLRLR
jgi:hypothetical protein